MLNGKPVACGMKYDTANKDCYSFDGNSWNLFATTFYHHHSNGGILLKGNLFFLKLSNIGAKTKHIKGSKV